MITITSVFEQLSSLNLRAATWSQYTAGHRYVIRARLYPKKHSNIQIGHDFLDERSEQPNDPAIEISIVRAIDFSVVTNPLPSLSTIVRSVLPYSTLGSTDFSFLDERVNAERSLKQRQDAGNDKHMYSRLADVSFYLITHVSRPEEKTSRRDQGKFNSWPC